MRDVFKQCMIRLLSKHYSNNDQTAAGIEKRSNKNINDGITAKKQQF